MKRFSVIAGRVVLFFCGAVIIVAPLLNTPRWEGIVAIAGVLAVVALLLVLNARKIVR